MKTTNYKITLDMTKTQSQISIPVPQNDTARRLYVRLYHNGKHFTLPNGVRAVLAAVKADGTVLYNDCLIENQSTIRYDFTEQTTAAPGELKCQLRVYGRDGALITSPELSVVVYENVFPASTVVSSNEFTTLNHLIGEANILISEVREGLENGDFIGESGVYVGSGEMPENVNVQIDPMGDLVCEAGVPRILYLDEDANFALLDVGDSFEIIDGKFAAVGDRVTRARVDVLETKVSDLAYEQIEIQSFELGTQTAEKGSTVSSQTYAWRLNRKADKLYLNGEEISAALDSFSETVSLREDRTYTLKAVDERGAVSVRTEKLRFWNGIYYGAAPEPAVYDSAFILTLGKTLAEHPVPSFTANPLQEEYIYYCLPQSMGECRFSVGTLTGGFSFVTAIPFKNAFGHTEAYRIYRSDQHSLGKTEIMVSGA